MRGVSPVTATIIMVGIALIVAIFVGSFVFNIDEPRTKTIEDESKNERILKIR